VAELSEPLEAVTGSDLAATLETPQDVARPLPAAASADIARPAARPQSAAFRKIVDRLAEAIVVVDDDETLIRFVNPAAERLFGRARKELLGRIFGFPLRSSGTTDIEIIRRGGETVIAELHSVDMEWNNEPAFLVSLRDVTERRVADQRAPQLAKERTARAEAEAASQAKSEFLAIMSDELRTPLHAVLGYTELLEMGISGRLTDDQRQQLGRIRANARHLLELVNEVLDLAKVETGRLRVEQRTNPAGEVVNAAVALALPGAEARGIIMPQSVRGVAHHYFGDETRVRQILLNLLSNAVKFTEPGGSIRIETGTTDTPDESARVSSDGRWAYFRVIDTGMGIPEDRLEAVFAPFVQIHGGVARRRDGRGLGLTIGRRLARLMGGDLTVRSAPQQGSTFTLWLPAAESDAHDRENSPPVAELPARPPSVGGLGSVGETLLRLLEPILDAYVRRLRQDPITPNAPLLTYSQLADHSGSYISDLASILIAIDEAEGQPSALIGEAQAIHRLIAELHGAQRQWLDWNETAMRREYAILREEIECALRAVVHPHQAAALNEGLEIIATSLRDAETISVHALERAAQP
jgi:signal transduction histidine kinase